MSSRHWVIASQPLRRLRRTEHVMSLSLALRNPVSGNGCCPSLRPRLTLDRPRRKGYGRDSDGLGPLLGQKSGGMLQQLKAEGLSMLLVAWLYTQKGKHMRGRGMVAPQCLLRVVTWLCVLLASGFLAAPAAAYKPE